jgi:hypothetical protein
MQSEDRAIFVQSVTKMARAFRLRIKPDDLEELAGTYFKILESASLSDVLAAGKTCLSTRRTFPKAAEWLQALPGAATEAPDCRVMGADEEAEYHRAERLRYEDVPCSCLLCQAAEVTHRPLRFVPDFADDGRADRAVAQTRNRIVVVGHWAHGEELARWYAARDAFYASVPRHSPMARALAILVPEREPGEEG